MGGDFVHWRGRMIVFIIIFSIQAPSESPNEKSFLGFFNSLDQFILKSGVLPFSQGLILRFLSRE